MNITTEPNALTNPLMTICFRSPSISVIKNELTTFGLNPSDWRAVATSCRDASRLILVHREDDEVRLAVKLRPELDDSNSQTPKLAIQNVEWLITGA